MNLADVRTLFAYNCWASLRMFSVLEKLTPEQFAAARASSFPSIRESVFHILAAEWIWLKRWQGASPVASEPAKAAGFETWKTLRSNGAPPPLELDTVAQLKAFCDALEDEREEFLEGLGDEALQATLTYHDMSGNPFSVPLAQQMQHVVNHGTYHRGQVTTLLRQAGAETIALDMIYFFREAESKAAASRG